MADDAYIQGLVNAADPEETIVLPWQSTPYELAGEIDISEGLTFDFNGNTILFKYDSINDPAGGKAKGFKVLASTVADRIVFRNGILKGDVSADMWQNHLGPVITSGSGSSLAINLFQIESMVFKDLTFGCNFNCTTGGYIRNAVLLNNVFDNIVQDPEAEEDNDPDRGKGAAFSFNTDKSVVMSGFSSGNVFRDCERHGLYVSQGGPFLSIGDAFFNICKDLNPPYPLGALALSRNSHMRMSAAYFENCRHGIVATTNDPEPEEPIYDLSITDCTFIESKKVDIHLNSGAPESVGVIRNVVVDNTRHINTDRNSIQINVLAFANMVLRNIDVEINQGADPETDFGVIYVYAYGVSNDLVIDGVKLRWREVPTTNRGIVLGSLAYGTGGNSPRIRIRNVETNGNTASAVYTGGVSPTNTNLVISSILP